MDALATPYNLTVALRSEHIERQCQIGTLRVWLHIEGFDRGWVVVNHNRAVKTAGNDGFLVAAEVVSELGRVAVLLQDADGFLVGDAVKWRLDVLEFLYVALQDFQFTGVIFHHALNDRAD